jgi:signal transduction histidine kinase
MEVFDVETDQLIERMELKQNLSAERERIGRELHDGAIQTVYVSGLILESARQLVDEESEIARQIDRAMVTLNEAIFSLRSYMTDLRESPQAPSLINGLQDMAANTRLTALMDVDLQMNLPESFSLTPVQSAHALAVVSEALANAARHGHAKTVQIRANENEGYLVIRVIDDGTGFVLGEQDMGYGLRNMRDRARILGGSLTIETRPQQGTEIIFRIPLESFLYGAD